MVMQINGQSTLKLKADVIDVDGLLRYFQAEGISMTVGTLKADYIAAGANGISTFYGDAQFNAKVNGKYVAWTSKDVITNITVTKTPARAWLYLLNGEQVTDVTRLVRDVTYTTETLNYFGELTA